MTRKYPIDCGAVPPGIGAKKITTDGTTAGMSKFGELIIKLALGQVAVPSDPTAQRDLLINDGGLLIPAGVNVEIIVQDLHNIKILVPPRELIEDTICDMQEIDQEFADGIIDEQDVEYSGIPEAYDDLKNLRWLSAGNSMEKFYEVRISDYTIGYCR